MKRVTIWGTTLKKVADEAQMITHYKIIKNFAPGADVTMLTYLKPSVQKAYPNLTVVPVPYFHKSLPRIFRSDLFVVAGGPFFDDFWHILRVAILLFFIKLSRVPMIIYGVTGFPIKSWFGKKVFKSLGNHARTIVTRDLSAFNSLRDMGVTASMKQGIDLRAILDPAPPERIDEILRNEGFDLQKPLIALTVRFIDRNVPGWVKEQLHLKEENIDRFNVAMGKLAAELSKKAQVFILAMNPDVKADLAVAENMRKYMDDPSKLKIVSHRYLATETLGVIKACDLLIAGRVGSAVFATMLETPLIGIAHEHRMTEWMEEIGAQGYVFNWQALDVDEILRAIENISASREKIKSLFHAKAKASRDQAWQDAEIYKEFLLR